MFWTKYSQTKKHSVVIFVGWIFVLALLLANVASKSLFNDEHDNWVGGLRLIQGQVLYRDYFSHHAPLTYYLSALWQITGFTSPLWMRTGVIVFWLISFCIAYSCVNRSIRKFVGLSFVMSAIAAPTVSAHMFLAESFVALLFMTLMWCGYSVWHNNGRIGPLLPIFGIVAFLIIFLAPVYIFALAIFLIYVVKVSDFQKFRVNAYKKQLVFFVLIYASIPFTLFIQKAVSQFNYDFFVFNSSIYFPHRLMREKTSILETLFIEPLKYTVTQIALFSSASYHFMLTLLTSLKLVFKGLSFQEFGLWIEVAIESYSSVVGNLEIFMHISLMMILILMIIKKKYVLVPFNFLLIVFLGVRYAEMFQSAPRYFGIITLACTSLHAFKQEKSRFYFLPALILLLAAIYFFPNFLQVSTQEQATYYPSTLKTAEYLRDNSLEHEVIQNLSGDVGLFHAVPSLKSASTLHFYYPWIHLATPLKSEVMSMIQSGEATLLYIPESLDYAPELLEIVERKYKPLTDDLFMLKQKHIN